MRREACDDGAVGKYVRIAGQHRIRHGAAGREPGDVDPALIDAVFGDHRGDHLPDGHGLALVAPRVGGIEPVEAQVRVVLPNLLGKEDDETVILGERRPAGAGVVAGGGLRAAVQHHHQGRRGRQMLGHMVPRGQSTRVAPELIEFLEDGAARGGGLHRAQPGKAFERIGQGSYGVLQGRAGLAHTP